VENRVLEVRFLTIRGANRISGIKVGKGKYQQEERGKGRDEEKKALKNGKWQISESWIQARRSKESWQDFSAV